MAVIIETGQLKLMDVPATARVIEVVPRMRCGYCGGFHETGGAMPVRVNGLRIHPKHKACIEAARKPLFDMNEGLFKEKSG